jgi:hypothetical protein
MSNATANFYLSLNGATRTSIEQATNQPNELGRAQDRIEELARWRELLAEHPDALVLQHALNQATVGLFLLTSGLYRPAFVSLRLFLELSLASIHFSTNRLELAEWLGGLCDVKWATVSDSEHGVLSVRYAKAFFPELAESAPIYNTISRKIYRELSEFVHGNHNTWGGTTEQIAFNQDLQTRWLSSFAEASTTVVYALCLRFLKELSRQELASVATVVQSCVGHVEPIRDRLTRTGN